jgi:DNA-3-methyladenine glycosylase II
MTNETHSRLSCSIALPDDFRVRDVLDFHGRDALAVAELIESDKLKKGLIWEGHAACLSIWFRPGHADVELAIDGFPNTDRDNLVNVVRRMLGLNHQIEDFENTFRNHPQLGLLIAQHPGLRVPVSATPFEALTWAITGQQISVCAAVSLRRKLIQVTGVRYSRELACYPDAECISNLSEEQLRQAGFSTAKAQTLLLLSRRVMENRLPLDAWVSSLPVDEIREHLLRVRGIGPWTINYALLRGFSWLDGSLHGDAAVRRQLQLLLGSTEKLSEDFAMRWLAEFSPWRAQVAAHLWAAAF